jgi:hypothetical protein
METKSEKGLDCSESTFVKFLIVSWDLGFLAWVVFGWFHGLSCVIAFATPIIVILLLSSPDITLYADGIETNHFGFKGFIEWKDIRNLHQWELGYKIWYRKTPLVWRLITLDSPLMMTKWCNNYDKASAIIEDNV